MSLAATGHADGEGGNDDQQIGYGAVGERPAANYERYFVPAIGAPLARELIELAQLRPSERVLDVACGTGVVARLAAEHVNGSGVVGVDVNPGMLEIAREAGGPTQIEWHEASAEALPFDDATFDVVFCQMGLQFFADKRGALREMRRVLRPGGRVFLNVPGPTPPAFAVLEWALDRHVGWEGARFVTSVFSLYEVSEIRGLLEDAGLKDVHAHSDHRVLRAPAPASFLWQYLHSTPLGSAVVALGERARAELERDVVAAWEQFVEAGRLVLDVDVTSATGRKA
jgi:ubiquinone/menaquinone biosynthesis C-methylase UbiE